MKRFIYNTLAIVLLILQFTFATMLTANVNIASAESIYLRVINEDSIFYANADESSPLFFLPYTYYVKVLGQTGGFYHVECYGTDGNAALDGYVKKENLFDDGLIVNSPFASIKITTAQTTVLYADASLQTPIQYLFAERQLKFYGSYSFNEEKSYYVGYNGRLGYVKESDIYPFTLALHPNELTFLPPEIDQTLNPEENPNNNNQNSDEHFSLKIIIIICLLFAGIVALFVALNKKPSNNFVSKYYDENDYE